MSTRRSMRKDGSIFVAGHRGLAGSAITRRLLESGFKNLISAGRDRVDLREQADVRRFFAAERPVYVFLAAGKVGGILANSTYPADFIYDNLAIEMNVIDAAYRTGVEKLLFLGSSCIYPKFAPQPIHEDALLTSSLEPTNAAYAIAKIAGLKLAESYHRQHGFRAISLMPTNVYGPGDNFDLQNSHVLPALIRKFHEAKESGATEVVVWGSGTPRREFLHVDDLADAAVFLMQHYEDPDIVNVGTGMDISIADLAALLGHIVGFTGRIQFDSSKPDGTPRKLLDVSRLAALGWRAKISLEEGIRGVYQWYKGSRTTVNAQ
jgi:GDP-L-fucose synthase